MSAVVRAEDECLEKVIIEAVYIIVIQACNLGSLWRTLDNVDAARIDNAYRKELFNFPSLFSQT
jgi:hypothetical protein